MAQQQAGAGTSPLLDPYVLDEVFFDHIGIALTTPEGPVVEDALAASFDGFRMLQPARHGKVTQLVCNLHVKIELPERVPSFYLTSQLFQASQGPLNNKGFLYTTPLLRLVAITTTYCA